MGADDVKVEVRQDFTPERLAMCVPDSFKVEIYLTDGARMDLAQSGFSEDDRKRLAWKINEIVAPMAAKMAANMLKGTLKYKHDDWPSETWDAMGLDDGVDNINYLLLGMRQRRKDRAAAEERTKFAL